MADEVVGEVRIDVHGNTEPLKDDIKRAARDIQKTINTEVASTKDTTVTDNLVGQVTDAEKPAGVEAQRVGRAIAKGVEVGSKDLDTRGRIAADLERAETPLRNAAERLGRSLGEATGRGMVDARREVASATSDTVRVNVETNRDKFRTDLMATEQEWDQFGKRMSRSLEIAFMPWWKARQAMRDDIRIQVEVDREKFRADLTDTEKDWFDFGQSLGKNLDKTMGPWWKHIGQSMKTWLTDDTGSTQIGLRSGRKIGEGIAKGASGGGAKDKARQVMAGFSKNLLGAVAAGGLQATIYGIGARVAAVLGGGLLSQLLTVGEGVVGWASSIVAQTWRSAGWRRRRRRHLRIASRRRPRISTGSAGRSVRNYWTRCSRASRPSTSWYRRWRSSARHWARQPVT
jgi:hypothetical protein